MNESLDITHYRKLLRLTSIFQRVNQISWSADQTKKRYPAPEAMTIEEMTNLIKTYLVLGIDIEDIYKDWKREYDEFKKDEK